VIEETDETTEATDETTEATETTEPLRWPERTADRTPKQERADARLAKALLVAFAEAMLDDIKIWCDFTEGAGEFVWDGRAALVAWAKEA
jgi:hypothetical protein